MDNEVIWLVCVGGPSDGVKVPVPKDATEKYIRADMQSYPVVVPEAERVTTRYVRYERRGDFLYATES